MFFSSLFGYFYYFISLNRTLGLRFDDLGSPSPKKITYKTLTKLLLSFLEEGVILNKLKSHFVSRKIKCIFSMSLLS